MKGNHLERYKLTTTLTAALCILIIVVGAIVLWVALDSNAQVAALSQSINYVSSGQLVAGPHVQNLAAGGSPLLMSLPSDLSGFVGRTMHVYSTTAQPHQLRLDAGSPQARFMPSGTTLATWDGTTSSGVTLVVQSTTLVVVVNAAGVTFS